MNPAFYIQSAELFFSEEEILVVAERLSVSSVRAELRRLRVFDEISALRILIALNIIVFPRQCPAGHDWIPEFKNPGQPLTLVLRCTNGHDTGEQELKGAYPLAGGSTIDFSDELDILCMFVNKCSADATSQMNDLDPDTVRLRYGAIREVLLWYDRQKHRSDALLGTDAGNTYVAVNETVARRKYERGRRLQSHREIVIGAVEVDHNGELTGRARLEIIPKVNRESIEPFIRRHVAKGAFVHTDCLESCEWLPEGGWPLHGRVNQKKTKAIQGTWMLVKDLLQDYDARQLDQEVLDLYTAEWSWRIECSKKHGHDWVRRRGVQCLAEVISAYFKHRD
jgi:hypothetical protein